jgi:hypothetical protein
MFFWGGVGTAPRVSLELSRNFGDNTVENHEKALVSVADISTVIWTKQFRTTSSEALPLEKPDRW